jgi:hypothetical protein
MTELTPQLPSTAFSDPIRWNREKEKTKTKKIMGWIENGPKKSGGFFCPSTASRQN